MICRDLISTYNCRFFRTKIELFTDHRINLVWPSAGSHSLTYVLIPALLPLYCSYFNLFIIYL